MSGGALGWQLSSAVMAVSIRSRAQWGAAAPRSQTRIPTPSRELWLHHTAGSESGDAGMRAIQRFHMAPKPSGRGWSDIAYSYVIDPETLVVYEARGAGVLGAHTYGRNSISHAICVMGNFQTERPSTALIARIAELVADGHRKGWWPAGLTGGHRDVSTSACPGDWLYRRIAEINDRAGAPGGTTMPTPNEPDPYDRRVQEAILAIDPNLLPEFGADGFVGAETAAAAETIADRFAQQSETIHQMTDQRVELQQQLEVAKRDGRVGNLLRQAIVALERG